MNFLNLNAIQTYISALLVAIPVALLNLGCTQLPTGDLDCTQSVLSPMLAGWILSALAVAKFLVLPLMQQGGWFNNLFMPRAPVVPAEQSVPGTVSPTQVRSKKQKRD